MLTLFHKLIDNRYKCIQLYRTKPDSVVARLRRDDGFDFICRLYRHPVRAYEIAAQLSCSALPHVYRCEAIEEDCYLIEEEFVDGISLAELLDVYHPDSSQTAAIAMQICSALEALHNKGIIHRDVKPENVLITSAGRVVLIDLDAATEYDAHKTRDTTLLGTAGYAAPEQFGFSRSNVRTDIFSLGVMLNVVLTGEHPSTRLTKSALRPVVEKCIEINVDKRYASTVELKKALAKHCGPDAVCPECGFTSPGGGCLCCGQVSAPRPLRKRMRIALLTAVVAAFLVIFACLWIPREPAALPEPEDSAPPAMPSETLPSSPITSTEETPAIVPEDEPEPSPTMTKQLYFSRHTSRDVIEETAGVNSDLFGIMVYFWLDADGSQVLPTDCLLTVSDGLGTIAYNHTHRCWLWTTIGECPTYQDSETTISAVVEGVSYSMKAYTSPQLYPLYTEPERDPAQPNENYITMSTAGTYSITFTEDARSVYAIPLNLYSCDPEQLTCDSEAFNCILNEDTGVLEIRYVGDLASRASCNISFAVTVPSNLGNPKLIRSFKIIHVPKSLEIGAQLYSSFPMAKYPVAYSWMQLPAENSTNPLFWLDRNLEIPVPRDAEFTCPPELGKIYRDAANACWRWNTAGAVPGASGLISVEVDGVNYRIQADVGMPWYGLYTKPSVDPLKMSENYIFKDENGKMNFSYSADSRTAYVIPLTNLKIDHDSVQCSSEAFSYSIDDLGVLHLTLKDGVTGTAETNLQLQGTMERNESQFRAVLQIVFSPA